MSSAKQQYVKWFRQSSPYINAYRGKVFVVMLPGEALAHGNFAHIAHDLALLNSLGAKLALVHGARPQIDHALQQAGLKIQKHDGAQDGLHHHLRITTPEGMELVKQAVGKLRHEIEAAFSMGLPNSPMHGAKIRIVSGNFVSAKPYGIHEGIDYCLTGEVRKIDGEGLRTQLEAGNIALLSNLGYSLTGEAFNLTVEGVASSTAIALAADKLLIYAKEAGILDQAGKAFSKLSAEEAQGLIDAKKQAQGFDSQLLNLELSVKVCKAGVKRSQVISYAEDGALLTELFTREGVGTLITQENYENLRDASIYDVGGIMALLQPLEEKGVLVRRSRELLEAEIECFSVIEREGMIIACGALYPQDESAGELACVVTHPDYRSQNRGRLILERIERKARKAGLAWLFALTTHSPHWFLERGFEESELSALPEKKKNLYNYRRNSKILRKALA